MNKTAIVQTLLDNAVGPGNWSRHFNRAEIEVLLEAAIEHSWDQYDKYRKGVRKEYEAFTDEQFRDGRKQFLLSFSGFITDEFNEVYLNQAKRNIARELKELE